MTDLHEPHPHEPRAEFLSHLEWQTRTRLRRAQSFDVHSARRWPALAFNAVLVAVSLLCGGAGVVAAEHLEQSRQKQLLLERTRIERDIARARLEAAQVTCSEIQTMHDRGLVNSSELIEQEQAVRAARVEQALLERDLEEIELSGRAPRRDLGAPLVAGRDFVTERRGLRREAVAARTEMLRKKLQRLQTLADAMRISRGELDPTTLELRDSEREVATLDRSLELRQAFLRGEITAARVDLQARRESRAAHLEVERMHLQQATRELDRVRQLHEAGLADSRTLRQSELAVRQAEGVVHLAEIEVDLLDEKLRAR